MPPHRTYIAVQGANVIRTEFAMAMNCVQMFPANTQRRLDTLVGMNKVDTFNTFWRSAKLGIDAGGCIDSVLLWEYDVLPYTQGITAPMMIEFMKNDEIDIMTPSWQAEAPDGVYPVRGSRTGFMFVRKSVFGKLDAPPYTTEAGQEVPRIFTDNDEDFVVLCAQAGIRWHEHGGVFVDYFDEAFKQAGVDVPALGVLHG